MQETNKTDNTKQPAQSSNFFNNKIENLKAASTQPDLAPVVVEPKSNQDILKQEQSINTKPQPVTYSSNVLQPNSSQTPTNITPNISGNITETNLVGTDSISKTKLDVSDINKKNKEIMSIDERMKNIISSQKAKRQPAPNIINNYGNAAGGVNNVGGKPDSLSGLRMTLRSLPSWRTEMG